MSEPAPGPAGGSRSVWSKDADKSLLPHEQPPVIATRRQREAALNPKEVEALRQLEQTFNAVCLAR